MSPDLGPAALRIDEARLAAALAALGELGGYDDARLGLRGVNRLALTPADGLGRAHVVERMRALGLAVTVDRIGNAYGRWEGEDPALPPLMIGSHIDSVPTAGRFDGCLGVLGGLEVVATLAGAGLRPRRSIVVAFFTDEEGCRFGTDMLGSAVATGRLALEAAYALTDREGKRLRDELEAIGFLGEAPERVVPPFAYLECHIEQGPVLAAEGLEVGVVTGVQGISWWELHIEGESAHAGTTPMELRHDAGVAAARINLSLRELIVSGRLGELRATMGAIEPQPGLVNIVPGRLRCTVDLRNPDEARLVAAEEALHALIAEVERLEGVTITARQTARTPPVTFDPALQDAVEAAAAGLGLRHRRIISGAGHDAQEFSRICPTAMIFVPGQNRGISHNPAESSTPRQCADGVDVLLQVVRRLCEV